MRMLEVIGQFCDTSVLEEKNGVSISANCCTENTLTVNSKVKESGLLESMEENTSIIKSDPSIAISAVENKCNGPIGCANLESFEMVSKNESQSGRKLLTGDSSPSFQNPSSSILKADKASSDVIQGAMKIVHELLDTSVRNDCTDEEPNTTILLTENSSCDIVLPAMSKIEKALDDVQLESSKVVCNTEIKSSQDAAVPVTNGCNDSPSSLLGQNNSSVKTSESSGKVSVRTERRFYHHRGSPRKYRRPAPQPPPLQGGETEPLCGMVFVARRFTAQVLYHLLNAVRQVMPEFSSISPQYTASLGEDGEVRDLEKEHRKQEDVLKRYNNNFFLSIVIFTCLNIFKYSLFQVSSS